MTRTLDVTEVKARLSELVDVVVARPALLLAAPENVVGRAYGAGMVMTRWTVTVDCADPGLVARFWGAALGYVDRPPPDGFATWEEWLVQHGVPEEEWNDGAYLSDPDGVLPSLSFLRVPEAKVVKNRLHIDVQAGGGREAVPHEERWRRVRAAVARLEGLGAVAIAQVEEGGRPDHVVMGDPEGNEFCVV